MVRGTAAQHRSICAARCRGQAAVQLFVPSSIDHDVGIGLGDAVRHASGTTPPTGVRGAAGHRRLPPLGRGARRSRGRRLPEQRVTHEQHPVPGHGGDGGRGRGRGRRGGRDESQRRQPTRPSTTSASATTSTTTRCREARERGRPSTPAIELPAHQGPVGPPESPPENPVNSRCPHLFSARSTRNVPVHRAEKSWVTATAASTSRTSSARERTGVGGRDALGELGSRFFTPSTTESTPGIASVYRCGERRRRHPELAGDAPAPVRTGGSPPRSGRRSGTSRSRPSVIAPVPTARMPRTPIPSSTAVAITSRGWRCLVVAADLGRRSRAGSRSPGPRPGRGSPRSARSTVVGGPVPVMPHAPTIPSSTSAAIVGRQASA